VYVLGAFRLKPNFSVISLLVNLWLWIWLAAKCCPPDTLAVNVCMGFLFYNFDQLFILILVLVFYESIFLQLWMVAKKVELGFILFFVVDGFLCCCCCCVLLVLIQFVFPTIISTIKFMIYFGISLYSFCKFFSTNNKQLKVHQLCRGKIAFCDDYYL
jgi:hypothetical protein